MNRTPGAALDADPKRKTPLWLKLGLAGYWLMLFLATHWPNPYPPGGTPDYPDKLVHFSLYGVLTVLAVLAMARARTERGWTLSLRRSFGVLAIVIAYGLFDETTQPLTGRDFEWYDWLADIGGSTTAVLLCAAYYLRPRRK